MLHKLTRRAINASAVSIAVLALSAGAANAHFCYFTDANVQAELGRADSNGFVTFGEIAKAEIPGLCDAGAEVLADAAGVSTSTVINPHATMAGGTLKSGKDVKPIDHLDIDAIVAAIPEAMEACG